MKPYYEQDGIQIFHGDCREVLPHLPHFDAMLTDPPYGVSGVQNTRTAVRRKYRKNDYSAFKDTLEYAAEIGPWAIQYAIGNGKRCIVTPGNRALTLYPPPDSFGAMVQPASVGLQPWGRADAQPILYYGKSPNGGKLLPSQRCSYTVTESSERNGHPCPKPLGFWKHLVVACSRLGEVIVDPFMGSGTTLRAAKDLNRRAIGIEIEERYCEIAAKRLSQGVLDLT